MIWYLNGDPLTKNQQCAVPLGVQGENATLVYTADVSDWLTAWPNGIIALLLKAPDGSDPYVADTATDAQTGTVTWTVSAFDTAIPGYGWGELRLVQGDAVKKSWTFRTYIRPSILADAGDPPAPTPDWVGDLLEEASEAMAETRANAELAADAADDAGAAKTAAEVAQGKAEDAQAAAEAAQATVTEQTEKAEAWAVGTKNGTPVGSGDPAYHNNAAYYATNAGTEAAAAGASAGDAEAWAKGTRNGSAVSSGDATYHNNSKYYAEQASGSATSAGTAKTAAETAQGKAETAQGKAEDAQTAAEAAQDAAEDAADAAEGLMEVIAPAYDAESTYDVGEYVLYNGSCYRCTTAITTAEAWTAAHWTEVTVGEELEAANAELAGMHTATASDEGKALLAKTVSGGKVTEWEFGEAGGGEGMSDAAIEALLDCFEHVAWIDDRGPELYEALRAALYGLPTSITASYTQSGTVYAGSSLDSLKPDLVVVAGYPNGTSRTVTDYTLSGSLSTGTSTITVTYEGLTDTFDVTVTASLPLYTINGSDLSIRALNNSYGTVDPRYSSARNNRLSYVKFDLLLTGGRSYKFTTSANLNTAQMGLQFFSQAALTAVGQNANIASGDVYDPGWQETTVTFSVPETTGSNSPIAGVRITFRADTSNTPIDESGLTISQIIIEGA